MTTANDQPGISAGMESDPDRAAATEEGVGRPFATGGVVLGVAGDLSAPIKPMSDIDDDEKRAFLAEVERPGSTPEPDSGPGFDRAAVDALLSRSGSDATDHELRQVEALLADRDRLATGQASGAVVAHWSALLATATDERDAARAEVEQWRLKHDKLYDDARDERATLRHELAEVTAERDRLRADVERYRPLWSDPRARPERWTGEPNPHPRSYVSTHEVLEDYDGAIRCSSEWPAEKRHAALDRTLNHVRPLAYEIEHLRAEVACLRGELDQARQDHPAVDLDRWTRDAGADALLMAAGFATSRAGNEEVPPDRRRMHSEYAMTLTALGLEVRSGRRPITPPDGPVHADEVNEVLRQRAYVELVAKAVHDHACMGPECSWSEEDRACDLSEFTGFGRAVLEALTADGWRPLHRVYGYHVDDIPGVIPPEAVTLIYRADDGATPAGQPPVDRALRRAATNGAVWALLQAARLCPHSGLVPAGALRAMADELLHAERIVPAEVAIADSSPAPLADTGLAPEPLSDAPAEHVTEINEGSKGEGLA